MALVGVFSLIIGIFIPLLSSVSVLIRYLSIPQYNESLMTLVIDNILFTFNFPKPH